MDILKEINDSLYESRIKRVEFAKMLDISQSSLSRILNAKGALSVSMLEKMCKALKLEILILKE